MQPGVAIRHGGLERRGIPGADKDVPHRRGQHQIVPEDLVEPAKIRQRFESDADPAVVFVEGEGGQQDVVAGRAAVGAGRLGHSIGPGVHELEEAGFGPALADQESIHPVLDARRGLRAQGRLSHLEDHRHRPGIRAGVVAPHDQHGPVHPGCQAGRLGLDRQGPCSAGQAAVGGRYAQPRRRRLQQFVLDQPLQNVLPDASLLPLARIFVAVPENHHAAGAGDAAHDLGGSIHFKENLDRLLRIGSGVVIGHGSDRQAVAGLHHGPEGIDRQRLGQFGLVSLDVGAIQ